MLGGVCKDLNTAVVEEGDDDDAFVRLTGVEVDATLARWRKYAKDVCFSGEIAEELRRELGVDGNLVPNTSLTEDCPVPPRADPHARGPLLGEWQTQRKLCEGWLLQKAAAPEMMVYPLR